jgi:tRNA acetyltransferase TAN1
LNEFNLILSTYRFKEEEAQEEILDLLESFGDSEAICEITQIKGVLLAASSIGPVRVIQLLRETTLSEPWRLRYVLRVIPVMQVVPTSIEDISQAVFEMSSVIRSEESFRITIEKRHSSLESLDIINAIASRIERRVDLENPDWIVLVEILAAQTGLAVIRQDEIFSSVLEKRK